jgi:hypothetical protein
MLIYNWAVLYRDETVVRILGSFTAEQLNANFESIPNRTKDVVKVDT